MICITSICGRLSRRHVSAIVIAVTACLCCMAGHPECSGGEDGNGVFPEIKGWSKDGGVRTYDSETLYEYINGAADLYVTYDFQKLLTLNYAKGEEQGLTVDIYRHSTPRNGFGIYSQERPTEGNFLSIGSEGYYDKGILNFVLGSYYVKLSGYYLGEEDESLLKSIAGEVAGRLDGKPGFPKAMDCLPDSGKIAHTERFIAVNFLGHSFLSSAYTAEYESEGQKLKPFILEGVDEADAVKMVESYLKLARDKGKEVAGTDGNYRFEDPYYGSGGSMNLRQNGRYVWGMFSDYSPVYEFYLGEIGAALAENALLGDNESE